MAKIWIVLPAYNEEEALPPLIQSLNEVLTEEKRDFSIVVVNDGSRDKTGDLIESYAREHHVIPIHNDGNKGLAETIRRGLVEATHRANPKDILITMDADNTHPTGLILRMVRLIREGNDVVIASRYREGSHIKGLTFFRRCLSFCASILFQAMFPIHGVRDYTSGYRAYRASVLKSVLQKYGESFITERGFSCMVDILLRLREMNLVFTEVPMVLRYDLKPGASKMNVAQTIFDTLKLLFRRRFLSGQ